MSGDGIFVRPSREPKLDMMRAHDYLYDSAYIVSGARDYARTAFKAAMASAQLTIQTEYKTMFSEIRKYPRMRIVYHPNCRLPDHMDRSYGAYMARVSSTKCVPSPEFQGKDRFKFSTMPKKILEMKSVTPTFLPPTPTLAPGHTKPRNKGTQSLYRESSAQTIPWGCDAKPAEGCAENPEVFYLDKLQWGPGSPYRTGDLPPDFHTTEIINKMRHARVWMDVVEKSQFPRWMKKRDEIIGDVETKDWIFREAEIDELQDIRLELLHRMQLQQRNEKNGKVSLKLAKLWKNKKEEMERKIEHIRHSRDREIRKLQSLHSSGGRSGLVARMRAARGGGSRTRAATDPASELTAPIARHGYQASRRHAEIYYDPSLLSLEDHRILSSPPEWLYQCGQDLTLSCSGHHLPRDPTQLCERETKWSEKFLENLHNDLKKARLGAVVTKREAPLLFLRPRNRGPPPRPSTPTVEALPEDAEQKYQDTLTLQRLVRGRAVQNLMYEGRTRAAELTEELKTTHGLQTEDRLRIAREEAKARDHNALRTEVEQKDDAIQALVDELCGGAVSSALDFLEKELRRLKEERRQHAFILIALREKIMREAAEAGRRQKEEHRRREHDEMFKQVVGVTQQTVDAYLQEIVTEGVELAAEEDAVRAARAQADRVDLAYNTHDAMSTAEQNETVAELVSQCLLQGTARAAARHRLAAAQAARASRAASLLFDTLDQGKKKEVGQMCVECGCPLDELCRCRNCPEARRPVETDARLDYRKKIILAPTKPPEKTMGERFPPAHDFRGMLNTLIDEVVLASREHKKTEQELRDIDIALEQKAKLIIEMNKLAELLVDRATGATHKPLKEMDYYHLSRRVIPEAMDREDTVQTVSKIKEPMPLPSEIRQRQLEAKLAETPGVCYCVEHKPVSVSRSKKVVLIDVDGEEPEEEKPPLPSQLRILEEMRRCKCDESNARTTPSVTTTYDDIELTGGSTTPAPTGEESPDFPDEDKPKVTEPGTPQ